MENQLGTNGDDLSARSVAHLEHAKREGLFHLTADAEPSRRINDATTNARPVRIAIIGAGPSAFYAAAALIEQKAIQVSIDILDRLPTPFGLVRHGVAPDHQKIKSVIKVYEKIAADPRVRFFGNLNFGVDVTRDDLRRYFDAIIYAYGSSSDRKLGIPGEDLRGSYSATEFVGWYNSHPDYTELTFDIMTAKRAAVIGNGNVAVDVARILATPVQELAKTDIADYALAALRVSPLEKIYMLGRRGPAQAAFTNPELKELGKIAGTDLIVAPEELQLDEHSQAALVPGKEAAKNVETLRQFAARGAQGQRRQLILRFLVSPVEIIGENGHVAALKLERNELRPTPSGSLQAHGTGVYEILPIDIVFRAVGYKGLPIPGVPYDERSGTIPNRNGRVIDPSTGNPISGEYVVGWAKRGPTGVIGTNKPDSVETARALLEDVPKLTPVDAANATPEAFESFIKTRQPNVVTYKEWQVLNQLEQQKGAPLGRPRVKFNRVEEMLKALDKTKHAPDDGARGETEEQKSKSTS